MTRCQFCGAWNADEDLHCGLCGRVPSGEERPRQRRSAGKALPALAAEPPPPPSSERRPVDRHLGSPRRIPPPGKVIPFESIAPGRLPVPEAPPVRRPRGARTAARSSHPAPQAPPQQASFSFPTPDVVPVATPVREARVAPIARRCVAAALDALLILVALGFFVATFHVMGGRIQLTLRAALPWGGVVLTLGLFYRLLWCALRSETAGMQFFRLRLLNFDGYEPEPAQRWLRLVAACLSLAAGGLGLLWAVFDEEHLTWHDHISKTFPTPEPAPRRRASGL